MLMCLGMLLKSCARLNKVDVGVKYSDLGELGQSLSAYQRYINTTLKTGGYQAIFATELSLVDS